MLPHPYPSFYRRYKMKTVKMTMIMILMILTVLTTNAIAEPKVVKGMKECPDGYMVGTKVEVLKWIKRNTTFLNERCGGINTEKLEKARENDTAILLLIDPESVSQEVKAKIDLTQGQVAIAELSIHPAATPTGGGIARTGGSTEATPHKDHRNGGGTASTTPHATLKDFNITLTPAEQSRLSKLLEEKEKGNLDGELEKELLKYQTMALQWLMSAEVFMYDEDILALVTPISVRNQKELEKEVDFYRLRVREISKDLEAALKGGNKIAEEYITQLIKAGALQNQNVRDLIIALREQGYLLRDQVQLLKTVSQRYKIENVEGDVVEGDKYENSTIIRLNGSLGNGSNLIHEQGCITESVFPIY